MDDPCSCAASSASAICRAIGSASSSGIGPRAIRCDEILALDQFHHQRTDTIGFFETVDVGDVRMIERRERLRFAREPRQAIGIAGEGVRQDLERDVAIERAYRARDTPRPCRPPRWARRFRTGRGACQWTGTCGDADSSGGAQAGKGERAHA